MFGTGDGNRKLTRTYGSGFLDKGTLKVVFLASAVIVLAVLLTGIISYVIAKNAVISRLKSKDLHYISQSIKDKIDGRITRAMETSLILADDPAIRKWIKDGEKDKNLEQFALQKITNIAEAYDYDNSFIVSAVTNQYWAENGTVMDVMSEDDPDDSWFFKTIQSRERISFSIDFNNERKDTFVFINALVGDIDRPLAVTGVGLNLRDISEQFESYKFGEKSNMWLVDNKGDIYISEDIEQSGENITGFLPEDIGRIILANSQSGQKNSSVLEYKSSNGMTYDLIYAPLTCTDWQLVLQIPRSESLYIVEAIKFNTGVACLITIILIVLMFYIVSNKIANPYKRAIELAQEMEKQVRERTLELSEKNEKIIDSIEYARMIQMSILPAEEELSRVLGRYFTLWRPRDVVGGDFYYVKGLESGRILIVGDCTGHGVPGALMTMAVNSILNNIVDENSIKNPGVILNRINSLLKQTLYSRNSMKGIDDGLDAGVIYIPASGNALYAGARTTLYIKDGDGLRMIKGSTRSIGYKDTEDDFIFENFEIEVEADSIFYITTDGYLHQNGGEKNFSYGRNRFEATINRCFSLSLPEQKAVFEEELES